MTHIKQRWAIVVLIYVDFRKNINTHDLNTAFEMTEQIKATINSLFKDLLTTPLDPNLGRMFVILNSIDYHNERGPKTDSKTQIYEIGNPDNLSNNLIIDYKKIHNGLGTRDEPNPGNPVQTKEFLKAILTQYIQIEEEEEVLFLTWDHGSAFGMFREVDAGLPKVRRPLHYDLDGYSYLAHFWNFNLKDETSHYKNEFKDFLHRSGLPDTSNIAHNLSQLQPTSTEENLTTRRNVENVREILTNAELAWVLTEWLNNKAKNITDIKKKVGVLLMMNCWMMNLHTMYSLQGAVKCLVAPQGVIDSPGYNYKAILKYLFNGKLNFVTPEELAIVCVTTSENQQMRIKSKKLRRDGRDMIDQWKIFAVDLQRKTDNDEFVLHDSIRRIGEIIFKINQRVSENQDALIPFLRATRLVSHDFTMASSLEEPGFMVDIINWLDILRGLSVFNPPYQPFPVLYNVIILHDIFELVEDFRLGLEKKTLVLAETSGKAIYNNSYAIALRPTGYSIFFPHSLSTNQNLITNVHQDPLLNYFEVWKSFLKSIYPTKILEPFFK